MTTTGGFTPEQLLAEEDELQLPSLSNEDAVAIGERLLRLARERALPVVMEVRRGPRVLFRAALAGSTADNDQWVAGKTRVVERFGHSSLYVRVSHEASGTTFESVMLLPPREFSAHGGAFPLIVRGTGVVGVVTVSGLPQVEDHALVVEALRAHLGAVAAG